MKHFTEIYNKGGQEFEYEHMETSAYVSVCGSAFDDAPRGDSFSE